MQDTPPLGARDRQNRGEHGYEPRNDTGETGASLWVATAVVIIILAGLSLFGQDRLSNGGAPFVITPSSQIGVASGTQNDF
ncbi:hypothetical protein OEG84_05850 [Hoeflea sp. G2-23]|uniref:Uncharacterized protein n=1 Tax=Hoeflea algicola TaxID=2983763 RepID=A0ABT3Z666_9HYPH|nr:hypothetical protein [Hoeflea algicola]MCY0147245.1 hypothetical protein [Hoeflea algicola]